MKVTNKTLTELNNFRNNIIISYEELKDIKNIRNLSYLIIDLVENITIENMSFIKDVPGIKKYLVELATVCFAGYQKLSEDSDNE